MYKVIASLFLLPTISFAFVLSSGGTLKFRGDSIVAETPKVGFQKYPAFDANDDGSEDLFLAIAMINAKVNNGGKVTLPDDSGKLRKFLSDYAKNSRATICSDSKVRDKFLDMVSYPLKTQYFNERNASPPNKIFVAPEKSGSAR